MLTNPLLNIINMTGSELCLAQVPLQELWLLIGGAGVWMIWDFTFLDL